MKMSVTCQKVVVTSTLLSNNHQDKTCDSGPGKHFDFLYSSDITDVIDTAAHDDKSDDSESADADNRDDLVKSSCPTLGW